MAFARNHSFVSLIADGADTTVVRPSNWNAAFAVSDAVSGGIPYFSSTTAEAVSALLAANSLVIGGGAGISVGFGSSTAAVAGATTCTCTGTLAAVVGAVGASNTIDIQATITKGGGASANHTLVATASLLNANATGITIA